ncbi:unnamed protein product [Caenorhabditis brenneri]
MGFPVLKLPSLARGELLATLTPVELYIFGKLSKKAARIVPESKSRRFTISVNATRRILTVNQFHSFEILEDHSIEYFNRHKTFVIVEGIRGFCNDDGNLEIIFGKRWSFTNFIIDVFMLFRCTVKSVQYQMGVLRLQYLLKYIQENQSVPIETLTIQGRLENRELQWILENIKVSKRLEVQSMVEPGFTVTFVPNCDILNLQGNWITDRMLQSFNSSAAIFIENIPGAVLTANSLTNIITGWRAGSYPKLEYLVVEDIIIENNVGVCGITTYAMLKKKQRNPAECKKKRFDGEVIGCSCFGVQIYAEDGKVAFLKWTSNRNLTSENIVRRDFGIFQFFCFDIDDVPQKLVV